MYPDGHRDRSGQPRPNLLSVGCGSLHPVTAALTAVTAGAAGVGAAGGVVSAGAEDELVVVVDGSAAGAVGALEVVSAGDGLGAGAVGSVTVPATAVVVEVVVFKPVMR